MTDIEWLLAEVREIESMLTRMESLSFMDQALLLGKLDALESRVVRSGPNTDARTYLENVRGALFPEDTGKYLHRLANVNTVIGLEDVDRLRDLAKRHGYSEQDQLQKMLNLIPKLGE